MRWLEARSDDSSTTLGFGRLEVLRVRARRTEGAGFTGVDDPRRRRPSGWMCWGSDRPTVQGSRGRGVVHETSRVFEIVGFDEVSRRDSKSPPGLAESPIGVEESRMVVWTKTLL